MATSLTRQWGGLQTFLHDDRVEIDSNAVENLIRPIVLTRKNALFAGHDEGGRTWARIASLIANTKINGVEPYLLSAGDPRSHRRWSPGQQDRRTASLELQPVKLIPRGAQTALTSIVWSCVPLQSQSSSTTWAVYTLIGSHTK
ncbi:transposase [Ferrimonas balearica]|nr:transposase [Ferrimonas balearica]